MNIKLILGMILVVLSPLSTAIIHSPEHNHTQQGPVIRKMPDFDGIHIPGFVEFRVQKLLPAPNGELVPVGEPYPILVNVTKITQAYRFVDIKGNTYSTMIEVDFKTDPIFIRQTYDEVTSSIRRGMEALTSPSTASMGNN